MLMRKRWRTTRWRRVVRMDVMIEEGRDGETRRREGGECLKGLVI
jgi:hypothetical protein